MSTAAVNQCDLPERSLEQARFGAGITLCFSCKAFHAMSIQVLGNLHISCSEKSHETAAAMYDISEMSQYTPNKLIERSAIS